jgi:hypothetical protein
VRTGATFRLTIALSFGMLACGAFAGQSGGAPPAPATGDDAGSEASSQSSGGEDCLNGADDDGNGLVDCADPACGAGYKCGAPPPAGWRLLAAHTYAASAPNASFDCGGGVAAAMQYAGFHDTPAMCGACTCDVAKASQCTVALDCYNDGAVSCTGSKTSYPATTTCTMETHTGGTQSCVPHATISGAACTASNGAMTLPPIWDSKVFTCESTSNGGGGCSDGEVCLPRGGGNGAPTACLQKAGETTCPAPFDAAPLQLYAAVGVSDTRACAQCGCTPNNVKCAGGKIDVYGCRTDCTDAQGNGCAQSSNSSVISLGIDQCSGDITSYIAPSNIDWSEKIINAPTVTGTCTPSGGGATGAIAPGTPVLTCCAQ